MTEQNEGWPLGLQPLHVRVRLMENRVLTDPNAFNTSIGVSPSFSSESSSDLDTVSTGSFFYDKSITLGNLIGHPPEQEAVNRTEANDIQASRNQKHPKLKTLCCLRGKKENRSLDRTIGPSLGQFLEVERRETSVNRREKLYVNFMYEELSAHKTVLGMNPLFVEGQLLPPRSGNPSENLNRNLTRCSSLGSRIPAIFTGFCGRTNTS